MKFSRSIFYTTALILSLFNYASAEVSKPQAFDALCASCHQLEGPNQVGPTLGKMISTPIASNPSFNYSKALKGYAALNRTWTMESLRAFLQNPMQAVPGTAMSFAGIDDEATLDSIVNYLADPGEATHSDEAMAIAQLEADPEYGEYLASECLTCHQADGSNTGIASIVGRDEVDFIDAALQYRNGIREHQVMQLMTQNLSDEDLAALAAYFKTLSPGGNQ